MQRLIFHTVLTRFLSTVLNFIIVLLLSRVLGPLAKGESTIIITSISFVLFFSSIIGGNALVYLIPRNQLSPMILPAYLWAVFTAASAYCFLHLTNLVNEAYVAPIILLSFFNAITNVNLTILLAKQRIGYYNFVNFFQIFTSLVFLLICFYALDYRTIYSYLISLYVAYFLSLCLSFAFCKEYLKGLAFSNLFDQLNSSLRYGFLYQLVEILQLFTLRFYFYILSLTVGNFRLGIYSVGISMLEAVWILSRSISIVHYSKTVSTNPSPEHTYRRIVGLLKFSLFVSFCVLLVIYSLPKSFYAAVFGEAFKYVKYAVKYLAPGILVYNITIVIGSHYLGTGRYRPLIVANLAGLVLSLVGSYWLIPTFVMSGAGLVTTVSLSVCSGLILLFFIQDYQVPLKTFLPQRSDWAFIKKTLVRK